MNIHFLYSLNQMFEVNMDRLIFVNLMLIMFIETEDIDLILEVQLPVDMAVAWNHVVLAFIVLGRRYRRLSVVGISWRMRMLLLLFIVLLLPGDFRCNQLLMLLISIRRLLL